ncbi:MAG: N-acetyltransferase [Clostridium sp.]|nr:N-acetyltransferase [Clostridium sp.]
MRDIYENCPVIEDGNFRIRLIDKKDADDLLKVYSDKNALPFFNSDNCNGDNFYFQTKEIMENVIKAWLNEYNQKGFVRFSVIDIAKDESIGTIELFNRKSEDYFNDCGLMRLDVRSDYEKEQKLSDILNLITSPAFELFHCKMIATKARNYAVERISALKKQGYIKTDEKLIAGNGDHLGDYWVKNI